MVFFLSALGALFWIQLYLTQTWLGLSFTRQLSMVRLEGTASWWHHSQVPTLVSAHRTLFGKELFLSYFCYMLVDRHTWLIKLTWQNTVFCLWVVLSLSGAPAVLIFAFVGYLRRNRISQIWLLPKFTPFSILLFLWHLKTLPHNFLAYKMKIIILILYNTYIKVC